MPVADPNRLAVPKQNDSINRTDSFKSERSDKRVSFNKDVGVKHIPRGQKPLAPQPPKLRKDEWSDCAAVHLEPPPASSEELERQAEDLVRLLDQVDCVSGHKSKGSQSQSLERPTSRNNNSSLPRNDNKTLNITRRNNLRNERSVSPSTLPRNKAPNPPSKNYINQVIKENVNLYRQKPDNNTRAIRRSTSARPSANDITTSDTDPGYEKYSSHHQSVPDIPSRLNNRRRDYHQSARQLNGSEAHMSVDNIYRDKDAQYHQKQRRRKPRNEYKSADNLTDVSIPGNRELHEYKSVENLQSGYSSSDFDMHQSSSYRPKVGKMVNRFNVGNDSSRSHAIMHDEPSSPRGVTEPSHFNQHNENKPFSYTGASLSSIEEVRRLSPARDIPMSRNDEYSHIQKNNQQISRSTSRENERNYRPDDADYSAKIIITSDPVRHRYDDDDAYETFQVGGSNLSRQMRELGISSESMLGDYKALSSNNMNRSSIGVQTETMPKAPYRSRRQQRSPDRDEYGTGQDDENKLSSANLVRRINHGFGRVERSPSPPPRIVGSRTKTPRNIVPLLSDTDESDIHYRRNMDPLAKIRDQVKIREKLQEEKEAEERAEVEDAFFSHRSKSLHELRSPHMQPLTIDEVDALDLEVDQRGRNSLVVSREGHSNSTSRLSNDRSWSKRNELERLQPAHPKSHISSDHKEAPAPPKQKLEKEKSPSKFFSTLERIKKGTTDRGKSTLERKDSKVKDKKKKRIKIKFFYDPRAQDAENEDPLNKFTEYKGTSSDEKSSPKYYKGESLDYEDHENNHRHSSYPRQGTVDKRDTIHSSSLTKTYNGIPNRPPRITTRDQSRDRKSSERDHSRASRSGRDSSAERTMHKDIRRSRDNLVSPSGRKYYEYPTEVHSRGTLERSPNQRTTQADYTEHHDRVHHSAKRNDIMANYAATRSDIKPSSTTRMYRERSRDRDGDRLDSTDRNEGRTVTEKGISLSDKYRSLSRHHSPPREIVLEETHDNSRSKMATPVENEEKKSKILRQRNKFLGVLRGEGRTKKQAPPPPSSTLPRTTHEHKPSSSSNTLTRTRDKEVPRDEAAAKIIEKVKEQSLEGRSYVSRDRRADDREKKHWESATLTKNNNKNRSRETSILKDTNRNHQHSVDSSASSPPPPINKIQHKTSFKQRYFGDTDTESKVGKTAAAGAADYRSLPNRKARHGAPRFVMGARRNYISRGVSPGARGSAGSSLQSSESEADSHGGSHASRASRASHISTGSNRSVYLHATAVADIPVRRGSEDAPSERGVTTESKSVTRSLSMGTPWKPRHIRERYEVEYDNRDARGAERGGRTRGDRAKSALPPRPPRKTSDVKKVGRSQTVYKDSKLAGWLRKRKNKEAAKGI